MTNSVKTLLMEGERTNLLPEHDVFSRELERNAEVLSFAHQSLLGEASTWEIRIGSSSVFGASFNAASVEGFQDYTFSFFAWSQGELPTLRADIFGSGERSSRYFVLTDRPVRFEVPYRFGRVPTALGVSLQFAPDAKLEPSDAGIFLAMPVLEKGLFASSPIDLAATRAEETLYFPRKGKFFEGGEGTISLVFVPNWSGHELSPSMNPCLLSCVSEDNSDSIRILCPGTRAGRLTAIITAGNVVTHLESSVIPVKKSVHALALRWSGGIADFIVNGWTTGSAQGALFPDPSRLRDRVYIGCDPDIQNAGIFGGIMQIQSWGDWLDDASIQAGLYESYPALFSNFRHAHLQHHLTLEHLNADGWAMPIVRQLLRFPDLWQEYPPTWLTDERTMDEGHFRNDIARALGATGVNVNAEGETSQGRTDLVVQDGEQRLRLECKVWGRHDYAEVPKKPLKYFTSSDMVGAVLMINPSKRKTVGREYRANVLSSATSCVGIIDLPFGQSMAEHFVSIHETDNGRFEVLHIVFDRFGPFGEVAPS